VSATKPDETREERGGGSLWEISALSKNWQSAHTSLSAPIPCFQIQVLLLRTLIREALEVFRVLLHIAFRE
jgi:hypothetical protein